MAKQKGWKAGELLYKYRSLNALHYLIDIIRNQNLYAAKFTELNDPMEGVYRVSDEIPRDIIEDIFRQKMGFRICAFSKKKNSTLMWSHYADSHRGVVLGVSPNFIGDEFEEISVVYTPILQALGTIGHTRNSAKEILSKKLNHWEYEEEVRVLTSQEYVPIKIEEVLIGCKAEPIDVERIRFLFKGTIDHNKIRQLHRDELDTNIVNIFQVNQENSK